MPRSNPSHRSNNYGLYGVLVLLLTAGYHHYFGKEAPKETEKTVSSPKIKNREAASLKLNKIDQASSIAEAKIDLPVAVEKIAAASAENEEVDFVNENDRENCWDYIRRSFGGDQTGEVATKSLEAKLLKKYPGWYLGTFTEDTVKRTTLLSSTALSTALAHLQLNISRSSDDPKKSDSEGIKILTNLYNDEPENSAYLIFLAIAHDKLGNDQQVAKLLSKLKDTEYFSTYRGETIRDVYKNMSSAEELMAAVIYEFRVSRADFYNMYKLSKKYDISKVAIQIMEKNSPKRKDYNAFDWDAEEYSNAERILEDRNPEALKKYISYKDFKEKIYEKFPFHHLQYNKALAKECEVKTLENQVKLVNEFVKKHPARIKWRSLRGVASGK